MRVLQALALLLCTGSLLAQSPEEDLTALQAAKSRLAEVQAGEAGGEDPWAAACTERVDLLEELIATAKASAGLPDAEAFDERAAELNGELAALKAEELPASLVLPSIEARTPYQQAARAAESERVSAESALQLVADDRAAGEEELAGLTTRGNRARSRWEAAEGEDELDRYRAESARLESRLVVERSSYLTKALTTWEKQEDLLRLELELATTTAERAKALDALAAASATLLREAEATRARTEAEAEERRAARESDPLERFRLRARAEAGKLRAEIQAAETEIAELEARESAERQALEDLETERVALLQRLSLLTRGVDTLLNQHHQRAERSMRLINEVTWPELASAVEANQLRQAEVLDRLWDVRVPAAENELFAALLDELPASRAEEAMAAFTASQVEDDLLTALDERSKQLDRASALQARILGLVDARLKELDDLEEFLAARTLWSRSAPRIDRRSLPRIGEEIRSIPSLARGGGSRLISRMGSSWPEWLGALALIALLRVLTSRAVGWRDASRDDWNARTRRFLRAMIWTLAPPAQLMLVVWAARDLADPTSGLNPLVDLFEYQALFVLIRRSTRTLVGKHGFLVHPRLFAPDLGFQIARTTIWMTVSAQVLYAPYRVLSSAPFQFVVLTRVLYAVWIAAASIGLLRLCRRSAPLVQAWTIEGGLLRPIVRFMSVFTTLAILPLVALDLMGYREGVQEVLFNSLKVFVALFVLGGIYRLLDYLGAAWATRFKPLDEDGEDAAQFAARMVSQRALLRGSVTLIVIAIAAALRNAWSISGPLSQLVGEVVILETTPAGVPLTGLSVLYALLLVALGHIIASNLRHLHEGLLAPFAGGADEGSRFAFLAIVRYLVLTLAYGAALLTLGFSFETLGWFATAASVGLGFGLQEIVANFVSGLILLFERPIRVGDIVTIGATSGKIESISMRATVITNWERQTIIVPNKEFVTRELTNWTRADKVIRRNLEVRVAYGTDVERVLRILDEVVNSHPAVLAEPPPRIWFQAFGVVGVEFQVLFFTSIEQGLSTRSEIHAMISARFAKEGIEIPTIRSNEEHLIEQGEPSKS